MNLVLCEGKEDKLLMEALATHLGITNGLEFESYDSAERLKSNLRNLRTQGRFAAGELGRILVTRDADSDPGAAWDVLAGSVRDALGVDCRQAGVWEKTAEGPEVAAWLVPAVGSPGMIESLCLEAARGSQPVVFGCLDPFVSCLETQRKTPLHPKEVFAYWTICGQDHDPRKRLSLERALSHLPFDWNHTAFSGLAGILKQTAGSGAAS